MAHENFKIGDRYPLIKTKLKEKYPFLTDQDLVYREGDDEMFIGRLQQRLGGQKRQKVIDIIKQF